MSTLTFSWATLPPLTDTPGTGGTLRAGPQDFRVDELPLYPLTGEGDYLFVQLEKTGHTTAHVLRELGRQLRLRPQDIGAAGLKDRHAVTTQWLSLPARAEGRLPDFGLDGVRVLNTARHDTKLGMGHLSGNRFQVRVRGVAQAATQAATQAQATLDALLHSGVPNYFGPQRFGVGGLNAEEGLLVMRGESRLRDPVLRRFLVSSVQSAVFNQYLALRLERGVFAGLLRGDMAKKTDTGGVFEVQDAGTESPRALRGEVSATGTLFGRKVRPLTHEAGELEREALAAFGLGPEQFSSRKGDRRVTRVFLQGAGITPHEDGYSVTFTLPRGAFATSVLRELTKTEIDVGGDPEGEAVDVGEA